VLVWCPCRHTRVYSTSIMRLFVVVAAVVLQLAAAQVLNPPTVILNGVPNNNLPGVVPASVAAAGGCQPGVININCPQQGILPTGINPITGRPYEAPCLPPACDPSLQRPMRIAKVEATPNPFCDCILKPECDCRFVQTVEPELKERVWCGCLQSAGPCGCRPSNYQLIKDTCGCLHLQQCPCRMEFVEPETRERHLEPELKERSAVNANDCACMLDAICPCRVATITPEIKDPPCPCAGVPNGLPCACAGVGLASMSGCPCASTPSSLPCGCAGR